MKNTLYISTVVVLLGLLLQSPRIFAQNEVYGWQMMTSQERQEYQNKMRSMTTAEERERYRMEHHKQMQERAKQRGISLPDKPGDRMRDRDKDRTMDRDKMMDRDRMNNGGTMGGQGSGRR